MMRFLILVFSFAVILLTTFSAQAKSEEIFNVLACEPEWAALVYALGDESFNIHSATTYQQDPHHIQARPSLIAKARKADLLICTGAELEAGWLPILMRKSSNANIQPGAMGNFMAAEQVVLLNQRKNVDRSEGDVHGAGNPHIHFDPQRMLVIANALSDRLVNLLPDKKSMIEKNLSLFKNDMENMLGSIEAEVQAINNKKFVVQHDSWVYLFDWLKVSKVAELEPKPGLPPTTSHLASLLGEVNQQTTDLIIYSSYQDSKAAAWMSNKTGVNQIQLPYSVEKWSDKSALPDFYKGIALSISQALTTSSN